MKDCKIGSKVYKVLIFMSCVNVSSKIYWHIYALPVNCNLIPLIIINKGQHHVLCQWTYYFTQEECLKYTVSVACRFKATLSSFKRLMMAFKFKLSYIKKYIRVHLLQSSNYVDIFVHYSFTLLILLTFVIMITSNNIDF